MFLGLDLSLSRPEEIFAVMEDFQHEKYHRKALRMLIHAGANLDIRNSSGYTPLHLAVRIDNSSVVQDMLEFGANPNTKDDRGDSPIHSAVKQNRITCLQMLLESPKLDLNSRDEHGETTAHIAARRNSLAILERLGAAGANFNLRDENGDSVLHVLTRNLIVQRLEFGAEMIFAARLADADPNIPDRLGRTAIDIFESLLGQPQAEHYLTISEKRRTLRVIYGLLREKSATFARIRDEASPKFALWNYQPYAAVLLSARTALDKARNDEWLEAFENLQSRPVQNGNP